MGRKLPTFAPVRAAAGRKRKGATLATLAACKRPAPAQVVGGWASLPTDMVDLIACRLLDGDGAGDVVDYITFRAVCSGWRASTPDARDPTLREPHLRPRGWIALCDGDAVRPDDACEIAFFHTRTSRRLRVRLPELRHHRIVVLLHKRTTVIRVLHPFTRVVVDLPSLVPVFHQVLFKNRRSVLDMDAVVCSASATSIAVVAWFPWASVLLGAEAGRSNWEVLYRGRYALRSILPFQGRLYVIKGSSREIMQLYPTTPHPVTAHVPDCFGDPRLCNYFLVESGGRVLLVVHHVVALPPGMEACQRHAFNLYALDIDRRKLIPVSCLAENALFLNGDRCLSVSARDLPSVSSNSIYFSVCLDPVMVHSLRTGFSERLAVCCQIHDMNDRIRPSVRPFTIIDHLLTYCHPHEWTKGLMFHEYHYIPESFEELRKNIKVKDSEVKISRMLVSGFEGRNKLQCQS